MCEGFLMYLATAIAKLAFTQLDPLFAVWYRVGFAAVLLLVWRHPWTADKRGHMPHGIRNWTLVAIVGLSIMLMNTMFYIAMSNMDMGIAVAIEFIGPLTVAVMTGNSRRERIGIVVAAGGVILLAGISLSGTRSGNFLVGLLAIVLSGCFWGVYIVAGRSVVTRGNSLDALCLGLTFAWLVQSCILAAPAISHVIHPKQEATWARESGGSIRLLLVMFVVALFASFIPYVIDQIVMRRSTSASFSVMQSVNPAMAVAVGLAFGEIPNWAEMIGVALVMIAVVITFSGDKNPV
jgi:inner membrane transporter RhtA